MDKEPIFGPFLDKNKKYFAMAVASILIFFAFDNSYHYLLGAGIFLSGMVYGYYIRIKKQE